VTHKVQTIFNPSKFIVPILCTKKNIHLSFQNIRLCFGPKLQFTNAEFFLIVLDAFGTFDAVEQLIIKRTINNYALLVFASNVVTTGDRIYVYKFI